MADANTVRGKVAVVGVGESTYYKRGQAPESEFVLLLQAILRACDDAGIDVSEVDGFASYANDRNEPVRVATALGLRELTFSNMQWGGGGGGGSGAIGNAAAGILSGYAKYVVVYRALAQGQFRRFGQGAASGLRSVNGELAYSLPYGMLSPAQSYAMKVVRFMHDHGVKQEALRAVSLASYHHAQRNPRAVMYGRPLTAEAYDESRWIVEPFHLFDCCLENDGAAAVVLTSAERARDLKQPPAYLLAAAQGSDYRHAAWAHNAPDYATSNFKGVARRLYAMAGVGPEDVDVAQVYENFTGGVVMSLVEHGFCTPEGANDFCTFENLTWPAGRLPINTSGGNLAECYMHGLELVIEAARQVRGQSTSQVDDVEVSLVASGPMVHPVSDCILAKEPSP